ncbi:MAG: GlsB/YeaQ/YmgE family stress response membrane protein [Hydrogenophaga sp.]|nr:GlsB/YeaQ/YmgE family stress response membrane protein [Hydrogenophaga sp.]
MNLIIWLIVGGVIGWLASILMKTDGQQGVILNVVVGVVGAMVGGWLLSPMVGAGTMGAVILLAIVNLLRRGSVR